MKMRLAPDFKVVKIEKLEQTFITQPRVKMTRDAVAISCSIKNIEKWSTVNSFEELGMIDPFNSEKSAILAFNTMKGVQLEKPADSFWNVLKPQSKENPKTVFIPSPQLLRTMVRSLIIFGQNDTTDSYLMRLGLMEDVNQF